MEIKNITITDLKLAEYNPRKISREVLGQLKKGIKEFGLVDPIIVNKDMTIIGGHQRYKACLEMGFAELPCVVLDITKSKEKVLNVALNKITGEYDEAMLTKLLSELQLDYDLDIGLTGFDSSDIDKLINDIVSPPTVKEWELDDLVMPFWAVIRCPIDKADKIKSALSGLGEDVIVETSL